MSQDKITIWSTPGGSSDPLYVYCCDARKKDFLREYEIVCRKYGMIASAYGWEITAYTVKTASSESITEHIEDLKDEELFYNNHDNPRNPEQH